MKHKSKPRKARPRKARPRQAGTPVRWQRYAWVLPTLAVAASQLWAPHLLRSGTEPALVGALLFYGGLATGVVWQSLNPVDFVERFAPWALLLALGMLLRLVPGGYGQITERIWTPAGVVAGVVLAAVWASRPRRRTRSRATTRAPERAARR